MLVQNVPMIDIDKPHEAVADSKDDTPKHWKVVHEPVLIPNSAAHDTNINENHQSMSPPVKRAKVSFAVREVVEPW